MLFQVKDGLLQKLLSQLANCVCGASSADNPFSCCDHMVCIHWRRILCLAC